MDRRITPEKIVVLRVDEIFVFGSNLAGRHGLGAALIAVNSFGAKYGIGEGLSGQTYAIPTKDVNMKVRSIEDIQESIKKFFIFVERNSHIRFLVTKIGCGYAGYTPEDIAPLFKDAIDLKNVYLPIEFITLIENNEI